MLRRWERSKQKFGFIICSDEGLTLETSAFQILHGGNFTFINSFDKTKFSYLSKSVVALPTALLITGKSQHFSDLPKKGSNKLYYVKIFVFF